MYQSGFHIFTEVSIKGNLINFVYKGHKSNAISDEEILKSLSLNQEKVQ